jgi:hypothetical protein
MPFSNAPVVCHQVGKLVFFGLLIWQVLWIVEASTVSMEILIQKAWYNEFYLMVLRSWDSSVSIATGYGLDGWDSILSIGKNLLFSTESRQTLGTTQPPIQWVREAIALEVKRPGGEADYLPPSSAEVKNCEAITSLPHISLWHNA